MQTNTYNYCEERAVRLRERFRGHYATFSIEPIQKIGTSKIEELSELV